MVEEYFPLWVEYEEDYSILYSSYLLCTIWKGLNKKSADKYDLINNFL